MKNNKYKKIAHQVIDLEIQALKKLRRSISSSFYYAVDAIVKCQSKIILCGVGKSYLIASKIAATLFLQTIALMEILEVFREKTF